MRLLKHPAGAIGFIVLLLLTVYVYYSPAQRELGSTMEHASPMTLLGILVVFIPVLVCILAARKGVDLYVRRIPGLNAIDEAIGRATEMGRPIVFNMGIVTLEINSLVSMSVLGYIARKIARFGSKIIVPAADPQVLALAEGTLREAYQAEGRPELFDSKDIRFLSTEQFAYAAAVAGIMYRERVAANFMYGYFYAESLIFAETGQSIGAVQIAGTSALLQIPFFVVTCDYTIIGDEFYAGGAYISRDPSQVGSLVGQDIAKMFIVVLVVWGVLLGTIAAVSEGPKASVADITTSEASQPVSWAGKMLKEIKRQLGQ